MFYTSNAKKSYVGERKFTNFIINKKSYVLFKNNFLFLIVSIKVIYY